MRKIVLILSAMSVLWLGGASFGAAATGVKALLEARDRHFFYAGDPFPIKISIGNDGTETVSNPVKAPLLKGLDVRGADGKPLKATGKAEVAEPSRPDKLTPNSGYYLAVDLTQLYPDLLLPGRYEIRWAAEGITSDTLVVRMLQKYDASKEYQARVETDEGGFSIEFFAKSAPLAVKAFIDMANAGFYEGLVFHKVMPDHFVEGGDATGDGSGRPPFTYPAELTSIPVVAGTVVMKPVSPSPPSNGSQFLILLRPEASWTGQATVLGQVVEGMDVLRKISRLPSTQQAERPNFKPLKDIHIRKINIAEKGKQADS